MKLSKNFSLSEFVRSETATRKEILNIPTAKEIEALKYLCNTVLQPCRDEFGPIRINSGYRSKLLNSAIGSSSKSNHCFGYAADIEAYDDDVSNYTLLKWIHDNCEYKELIAEYFNRNIKSAGWVHVAAQENNNIGTLKIKDPHDNYKVVNIDYISGKYA
jgi:zinc D-Ala-D-Ala carboxypeptidase